MSGADAAALEWPELVAAIAALGPADAVLEVGTGSGAMFGHLLRLLSAGGDWTLTTVDADRAALESARARIRRLPPAARQRVTAVEADVVDFAQGRAASSPRSYRAVIASALLSAVPHVRAWGAGDVLAALAELVATEGMLLVEDYLPLCPPVGDPAPSHLAQDLWRWYKAVAELAGRPHYEEVPPAWVEARLRERGFRDVRTACDNSPRQRALADLSGLAAEKLARPPRVDEGLWFALDRYRRDRLRAIAAAGELVQWSGWYRICARRGGL